MADRPDGAALRLLNDWQRDFPLVPEPFAEIGRVAALPAAAVIAHYRRALDTGALSRIGGVFSADAGGAALLAAMAVPEARLDAVAALVSAHPGVNHNYAREHRWNLWFVMTGPDAGTVDASIAALEAAAGLRALRLPMLRPYRIDLGFDLSRRVACLPEGPAAGRAVGAELAPDDRPLAARVEDGLPLVARPFDAWADALHRPPGQVLDTLRGWLRAGVLRRFGAIVRHHELGFAANAMTVFDVPDDRVDACGAALARVPAVTLAYRRRRDADWRYNLYCMVHGRDRDAVNAVLREAIPRCGLERYPHAVLFSTRRFKQTGARRFRAPVDAAATHAHGAPTPAAPTPAAPTPAAPTPAAPTPAAPPLGARSLVAPTHDAAVRAPRHADA